MPSLEDVLRNKIARNAIRSSGYLFKNKKAIVTYRVTYRICKYLQSTTYEKYGRLYCGNWVVVKAIYMGRGTAWGGHLFCTQKISGDRYPGDPPLERNILWNFLLQYV